jgi:hypothetical protein
MCLKPAYTKLVENNKAVTAVDPYSTVQLHTVKYRLCISFGAPPPRKSKPNICTVPCHNSTLSGRVLADRFLKINHHLYYVQLLYWQVSLYVLV